MLLLFVSLLNILVEALPQSVLLRDTETLSSSYHSFVVDQDIDVTDPYFSSSGKDYQAKLGGSVTFYCQVENIGTSTLIWKKDNRIISAGPKIIRKDQRFSLSGSNLTMHNIQVKDEGDYVCEVETYTEPIHQENFLTVLIPPSVEPHPKDGKFVVRAGSTITLGCRAEGNPRPVISWRKERSQLPTGKSIVEGNSILIQNVGREDTGRYLCVADNGVGKQASAIISLTVLRQICAQVICCGSDGVTYSTPCAAPAGVTCVDYNECPAPEPPLPPVGCPGCPVTGGAVLSEEHQAIVDWTVEGLQGSDGLCKKTKVEVNNFSTQVVAGTMYEFDLVLDHAEDSASECGAPDGLREVCHMAVWEKVWEDFREVQWDRSTCIRPGSN